MEMIEGFERHEFKEKIHDILTNSLVEDNATWKEITKLTHKKYQIKREVQELWANKKRPSYSKRQILQLNREHNNKIGQHNLFIMINLMSSQSSIQTWEELQDYDTRT